MKDSNTLFCSSKFPWVRKRISAKFISNLGTRPKKGSPALYYNVLSVRIFSKLFLLTCNPFSLSDSTRKATCFIEINTSTNDIACSWMLIQNNISSKFPNFVIIRRQYYKTMYETKLKVSSKLTCDQNG